MNGCTSNAARSAASPSFGEALLNELSVLKESLKRGRGAVRDSLGPLSLSIASLVEQFPLEDPLGLGIRLLGALSDLSAAITKGQDPKAPALVGQQRALAAAAAAEAAYLLKLSEELGYGRPERAVSAIGRVEALEGALAAR